MSLKIKEIKTKLGSIIREIGEEKDGFITFKKETLLRRWEACGFGKFKNHGFGKMSTFLQKELFVEEVSSDKLRIASKNIVGIKKKDNDKITEPPFPHAVQSESKASSNDVAGPKCPVEQENADKQTVDLNKLKVDVLTMIQKFLQGKLKKKHAVVTLDELNIVWQNQEIYPKKKFKEFKCGTFKSFLTNNCNLKLLEGDASNTVEFQIEADAIKTELESIKSKSKSNKESDDGAKCGKEAISGKTSVTESLEKTLHGHSPDGLPNKKGDGSDDKVSVEEIANSDCSGDSQANKDCNTDGKIHSATSDDSVSKPERSYVSTSVKKRNINKLPETRYSQSQRLYIQSDSVLTKCGGEALRDLFRKIHTNWKPSQITNFRKGTLQLKGPVERAKFESGDIDTWDIALMAKVLLYSETSQEKLDKDSAFQGCKDAVEMIRAKRNFLSHDCSKELTESDCQRTIRELSNALVNLGFDMEKFKTTLEDAELCRDSEFFQKYHKEIIDLKGNFSELKGMLKKYINREVSEKEIASQAGSKIPDYDEWLRVSRKLENFDTENFQYILMIDKFKSSEKELIKILGNIPWKLVIDLDPDSDNDGVYAWIKPGETRGGNVTSITPSKINPTINVESVIDSKKMQWVFANGRNIELNAAHASSAYYAENYGNKDEPKKNVPDWRKHFKKPIEGVIRCICDKLDPMKPTFCIILGIQTGLSSEISKLILEEVHEEFEYKSFAMSYVSFASELDLANISGLTDITTSNLSFYHFLLAIASHFNIYQKEDFALPSIQTGTFVPLKQRRYNYLKEYLEILYKGCEDIPENLADEEKKSIENQHLKIFISGNPITFQSLVFRHDVTRNLTGKIIAHISQLAGRTQKPQIVQIIHAPGSGGTTIARRVLWDLHDKFPCAILNMDFSVDNLVKDLVRENYVENICDRISKLEEICELPPVILIDGNSTQVRTLSDYIVRSLKGRAIVLRCIHYDNVKIAQSTIEKDHGNYLNYVFVVNPDLKDDNNDYLEFQSRYAHYSKIFQAQEKVDWLLVQRVFHFPMMAMLGKFDRLNSIVNDSLSIIKKNQPTEYEIAIIVAFLQLYADGATPASLISKHILKNRYTYEELTNFFSITLKNLMVPGKPKKKRGGGEDASQASDEIDGDQQQCIMKYYTFQHQKVAELVLQHCEREKDQIAQDLLDYKVIEDYGKNNEIRTVVSNLFLHCKTDKTFQFSKLVTELAKKSSGGRIFEEAAKQSKDAAFFSHVARFFAYNKFDFEKARHLIKEGLNVESNASEDKKRHVFDTFGHIVYKEMTKKSIPSIDDLKIHAQEALDLFGKARDDPPRKFPNPLIGEVTVWQFCFQYLIKDKDGNTEEALKFIFYDDFFAGSVPECISLLHEVLDIVATVRLLPDHSYTEKLAYRKLNALKNTIGRTKSSTKRAGWQDNRISRLCDEAIANLQKKLTDKSLIRFQATWLMLEVDNNIALLDENSKEKLFFWLKKLVTEYNMFDHARDLMNVAALREKSPIDIDIDKALDIINTWQIRHPYDYQSYFYQYILCFIKICEYEVQDYKATYETGLDTCKKKTDRNFRTNREEFYIGKDGKRGSIFTLVSRSELELLYTRDCKKKYGEKWRKDDPLDSAFWQNCCRDYLLECRGRIQSPSQKNRQSTVIIMEPGNIKLSVHKNALGRAHYDYQPDSKVSFVVAFTLGGPRAKEIRFTSGSGNKYGTEEKEERKQ